MNQELEKAGRVADFLELGELLCWDALQRNESCGGHFREEFQTPDGEAMRNDDAYCYAAAWEYKGPNVRQVLHREALTFEHVHLTQRSYK
jgi:succinate dehydrogenase / fumarate reductase flavoprotein subunit